MKSSVKLHQENPGKYELNTDPKGPTFVPKGTNKGPKDCGDSDNIDRSFESPEQDFAQTSEHL